MKRRAVHIKRVRDSWLVLYCQRAKGQRYTAAQFYAPSFSLAQVEAWVSAQPNLVLCSAPAHPRSEGNFSCTDGRPGRQGLPVQDETRAAEKPAHPRRNQFPRVKAKNGSSRMPAIERSGHPPLSLPSRKTTNTKTNETNTKADQRNGHRCNPILSHRHGDSRCVAGEAITTQTKER